MKITNYEAVESMESLIALSECKLPIKVSYKLSQIIRKIEEISKDVDSARAKLHFTYGKKREDGTLDVIDGKITVTDMESYSKEHDELMSINNDCEFSKINLACLPIDIEPKHLCKLYWLFQE